MPLIQVDNLTKVYRSFRRKEGLRGALVNLFYREYQETTAVDRVSFQIDRSELVGYIGPNGAGKSTTIKMLTGILIPTSGDLRVCNYVPYRQRHEYTRRIGVVFGQRTQLWWDIPVIESFRLLQKVYQIPRPLFDERMQRFNQVLDVDAMLQTPVRKLSLGQRMRCDLVASLLHNPEILFLDEPTIGLDVIARLSIREFLRTINRDFGVTIILTTHDLREIEEICKRLIIIDQGKILFDGTLVDLKKRYALDRCIIFQFNENTTVEQCRSAFPPTDAFGLEQLDPLRVKVTFRKDSLSPTDIIQRMLQCAPVHDIAIEEPSIEEIVGKIYSNTKDKG